MQIAIIANPSKPDAVAAAHKVQAFVHQQSADCSVQFVSDVSANALARLKADLVIVLGGDGTLLQAARFLAKLGGRVVGINFGKLGYMAAFSVEQFQHHWVTIASNQAPVTNRLMLHACIGSGKKPPAAKFECLALNEVAINSGSPFRMLDILLRIDGQDITTFRGDGVVVSTASGSTGYNLSAGGPLLSPAVEAIVLTPICAHSLSFRPVVLPAETTVELVPLRVNPGSMVNFDGQVLESLAEGQTVTVRKASEVLRLVENPDQSHWQMLGSKLQWAQNPRV